MEFRNRLKKELTEGVIRALMIDAGYRVIDFGIENQIREIVCMPTLEYLELGFPQALRVMPDMVVMDRDQTTKHLVEIKYRNGWSLDLLQELEQQVATFGNLVLVCLNASPEIRERTPSPSTYLRACRLRHGNGVYQAEMRSAGHTCWTNVDDLGSHAGQWWGLSPMQEIFPQMNDRSAERTLTSAIEALRGIIAG